MPEKIINITGVVTPGLGEAAGFTSIPWVRESFIRHLGIDPWPGTLNLAIPQEEIAAWQAVQASPGTPIPPGAEGFCGSRGWLAEISTPTHEPVSAAIILPEVSGYPPDKLELVSASHISEALGCAGGDALRVRVII